MNEDALVYLAITRPQAYADVVTRCAWPELERHSQSLARKPEGERADVFPFPHRSS